MAAPGASDTVVVVTGGDPVDPSRVPDLPAGTCVIAADSGIEHAHALGLVVDIAVGDFDSVSPAALARATESGARVERHPAAKDATDLELALDAAVALRPARVLVLGGDGGRLDHLLANALLLGARRYEAVPIVALMGAATITIVRGTAELHGARRDLVTLLPLHGPAADVTTSGLLYPLWGEDLLAGSTRGVSNELVAETATVTVGGGTVAVIQPGARGTHQQEQPR